MADGTGAATNPGSGDPMSGAGLNLWTRLRLSSQIDDEQPQVSTNAGAAMGAGYQFTPEQIERNLTDAQDLIRQYQSDWTHIETIIGVHPPTTDPANVDHARELALRGQQLMARNRSQITFLQSWTQTLQNAKNAYMEREHVTAAQWAQLASGMDT